MSDRFYFPGDWDNQVTLQETEAHHLSRVMRKQVGDEVELFNGRGGSARAKVHAISKRDVQLDVLQVIQSAEAGPPSIILAVAPPKGDRFRWLVEKATELGVARLIPIQTERSIVEPGSKKLEKLEHTVIAACKQSTRNTLMQIDSGCSLSDLPEQFGMVETTIILGSPQGGSLPVVIESIPTQRQICIVIGPEGGFSPAEEEFLHALNARKVRLSQNILRVETAAIALSSAFIALLSD